MSIIYLDNAASTWPKPPEVRKAMIENIDHFAANPGRGGHQLAVTAGKTIQETRSKLARLFNVTDSRNIIFFSNATAALNQAIKGLLKNGDHVVTTMIEHNSVRRPLEFLRKERGISISYVSPETNDTFKIEAFEKAIQPETKLIVVSHASNLTGMIIPVEQIGHLAREKGIIFLVDASQTAGILPIDVEKQKIDMLAFPGHKGLYGPQGTGGLYLSPDIDLIPLMHGGTGSKSENIEQPEERPDRYESGTLNTVGIAGLSRGVDFVLEKGVDEIRQKEQTLTKLLMEKLMALDGVHVYGPHIDLERVGVVSFNIEGIHCQEVASILDQHYQIAVRAGYHCTPLAHQCFGTMETGGSIRASFGYFNSEPDVEALVEAVKEIKEAFI
ncbi:MAG: aminotransferase class V-fold PLP-dependent enzyme [Bacillaceae bacterium]|nr:aminotransferase class V-fold PLP-dependent enzyme [Bacillaceae bacterium]